MQLKNKKDKGSRRKNTNENAGEKIKARIDIREGEEKKSQREYGEGEEKREHLKIKKGKSSSKKDANKTKGETLGIGMISEGEKCEKGPADEHTERVAPVVEETRR